MALAWNAGWGQPSRVRIPFILRRNEGPERTAFRAFVVPPLRPTGLGPAATAEDPGATDQGRGMLRRLERAIRIIEPTPPWSTVRPAESANPAIWSAVMREGMESASASVMTSTR